MFKVCHCLINIEVLIVFFLVKFCSVWFIPNIYLLGFLWLYNMCGCWAEHLTLWLLSLFYFLCRRLWIEEEKHVLSQLQDIGQVCKYGVFVSFWNKPSQYPVKKFYPVHTYQTHKIKHRSTQLLNIVKFIENLFLINEL